MNKERSKIWFRAGLGIAVWVVVLAAAFQLSRAQTRGRDEGSGALDQFIEVAKPSGINFKLTSGGPDKTYII